ncbi:hypothetical protein [Cryobacterium zhongshanensis]|uniref:Uncharacterized protein n=1 Tax=Cryobacterium zhongshanensis TaxID=2928153 RepID=A0AA41UMC2_9MICO|nr:hypothetical protein [Cryobacterium zhongshanensis]MCI4659706.1 hypothetical protein [Cryobacterium zhongshanensis]
MPTPAINTPQFLHLNVQGTIDRPSVKIRVIHNDRAGVYTNASLTAEHPTVAITPTLLSKMRLGAIRRDALRVALGEQNAELSKRAPVKSFFKGTAGRAVAEKARLAPTAEHLENTVLVYRLARLVGDYPVQAVARCFSLEHDDAARWVAIARKSGDLA